MIEGEVTKYNMSNAERTQQRLEIMSCLAVQFQDLSRAIETNLHRACRVGDCTKVSNVHFVTGVFFLWSMC